MITSWPDSRIVEQLGSKSMRLLTLGDAILTSTRIRDDLQAQITADIAAFNAQIATMQADHAAQIATLNAEIDTLARALEIATRPLADVYVTIATAPFATSQLRTGMTIVDNNLMFNGATAQKELARANLGGKLHDLGVFVESFGHGQTLPSWNGTGTMPALDFTLLDTDIATNYFELGSPRLHAYMWRLPWQLTANYNPSTGVYTPSTSADYNSDGRRVNPSKMAQFTEWSRRVGVYMMDTWGCMIYHGGSEFKGYQESGQGWGWTAFFDFAFAMLTGLRQAATDLSLDPADVILILPYPVVAHQGDAGVGTGQADAVTFDTRNDSQGNPVDYSLMNGNNVTYGGWGYPNKAALEAIDEFLRLWSAAGLPLPIFGVDFGTYNNDNVVTPGISDHDLAYLRAKRHLQWYKQRLAARGFSTSKICLDEWYAKAQRQMQVEGAHFIPEDLRDDYQASIKAAFLIACLEEGLHLPMIWSPFGRGDQATDAGFQSDPNQWYGGMVVRTVGNNNDHPGSAIANGGAPQAFLGVVEILHDHFAEGTPLYAIEFDQPGWRGIGSDEVVFIINESGSSKTLHISGDSVETFGPYECKVVGR